MNTSDTYKDEDLLKTKKIFEDKMKEIKAFVLDFKEEQEIKK